MADGINFSIFTKAWRTESLPALGAQVLKLGFTAIELPVRPGFQVTPDNCLKELPAAAKLFADHGIKIASISGGVEEKTFEACGVAGVPLNRICITIPKEKDYLSAVQETQREWDKLVPILDKYKVALGIQNHCNRYMTHAMHLRHALEKYDKRHICAVWDAAHQALQGEDLELALDVVWPHLAMVNLKNAYWRRKNAETESPALWESYWTTGRHGLANWKRVAAELKKRGYKGTICLTAEYHDKENLEKNIADDLVYMRECFG